MSVFISHNGTIYTNAYVDNNKLLYERTLLTGLFIKERSNEVYLVHNCDIVHVFINENGNFNFTTALADLKAYFQSKPHDPHFLVLELIVIAFKENYVLTHNHELAFTKTMQTLKGIASSME